MTTRKQLIIQKYTELQQQLKPYLKDISILPSLEDIDISDLVFYFTLTFQTNNYKETIRDLLQINSIKLHETDFNSVYDIIMPFVIWFKELK